ncbi:hypothetical protein HMPREF6745_1051 [Prevotella sp. oral taxon 472 str. F0295]|nr:hypothetical protein HMPREF6745_1051 [Prevotella sp. oral taxon 472 str. F0295]
MGSVDVWDLVVCCICMACLIPCILYSSDRYDRIIRVDVHGFSDCFRIVFSAVYVGYRVSFSCPFSVSCDGISTPFSHKRKGNGTKR